MGRRGRPRTSRSDRRATTAEARASAAPAKPRPAIDDLDRAAGDAAGLERGRDPRGELRSVRDDGARTHGRRALVGVAVGVGRVGGRLVEDRAEPGVAAAQARLVGLRRRERLGGDGVEHVGQRHHIGRPHRLEEPGRLDHGDLGAAGEDHLTAGTRRCPRSPGTHRAARAARGSASRPSESPPVADVAGTARRSGAASDRGQR